LAGPYTCSTLLVKIDNATVGVVVGLDIELSKEGGVQHYYGTTEGKHVRGGKRGTFRIQRWYQADTDTDLLYDLFNLDTEFRLSGEIDSVANSMLYLDSCMGYRYRLITGDANTVVAEELTGESTDWTGTDI